MNDEQKRAYELTLAIESRNVHIKGLRDALETRRKEIDKVKGLLVELHLMRPRWILKIVHWLNYRTWPEGLE